VLNLWVLSCSRWNWPEFASSDPDSIKKKEKKERGMSSSSGYVAIPRCPVIFDSANYPDFTTFMRVHMRGLRLWGVLSGEVSCPPCPTPPLAPISLTLPTLGDEATQAEKAAAESADRSVIAAYDLQF
jgi:hypothetical protein